MGFFDGYQDLGGGGQWADAPFKKTLIDNGITFQIVGVTHDPENVYGPRFVAFTIVPDFETGEDTEVKIGFPIGSGVGGRDAMLTAMKDYLEKDDAEPVYVKLEQPNKAILITPADAPAAVKAGKK